MAKRGQTYSPHELQNLNRNQLIKVIVRQAEKYNKQITRAKQKGLQLDIVGGDKRVKRDVSYYNKLTDAELVRHYFDVEQRFGAGATASGLKKNKQNLEDALRQVFNLKDPEDQQAWDTFKQHYVTDDNLFSLRLMLDSLDRLAKANMDKLWYNDAMMLVESGQLKSMSRTDITGTLADYASLGMDKYIEKLTDRYPEFINELTRRRLKWQEENS